MKLDNCIKIFIVRSISEMGIIDLKFMVEFYGTVEVERALKIINYLRLRNKLIIKKMYSNCTKVYSNYYNYDFDYFVKNGYIFEDGFYVYRDFASIA